MTTPTTPPRRWLRFLRHPIVWTTLGIVAIFAATGALLALGGALGGVGSDAAALTSAVAAVLLYLAFRRGVGGRATPELAARGAAANCSGASGQARASSPHRSESSLSSAA